MRRLLVVSLTLGTAMLLAAGPSASSPPPGPFVLPGGWLYVASAGSGRVLAFDGQHDLQQELQSSPALDAPAAVAVGPDGNLYVACRGTGSVVVLDPAGAKLGTIVPSLAGADPVALGFGPDGQLLVLDAAHDKLFTFNTAGAELLSVDLPPADYDRTGLAVGAEGHLFLSDTAGGRVLEVDLGGALVRELGLGVLVAPAGLATGPDGLLCVADGAGVVRLDSNGDLEDTITGAALDDARGVAFGPEGHLFVTDAASGNVVEFTAAGAQVGPFGAGAGLAQPGGLAFAPWRFKATIRGTITRPGTPLKKVTEANAVLAIQPGGRTLVVALTDDVSNISDLASVFGADFVVLHGFEGQSDDDATTRLFQGAQAASPSRADGVASLVVRVKGSMKAGVFTPKAAVGVLHRAGVAGVCTAAIRTTGLLK